ncbi:bL28 family ribosomal protein [Candidatus Dojkabacteria bacterium]|jgi:ribosomal protein L28|nr:bL28 family ribosomal protein [Candidatus Dojkabacteria bacterium]
MTKTCAVCGKKRMAGRSIQHKHSVAWRMKAPATARMFELNLRKIDLETDNGIVRSNICMKCYKKLRKEEKPEVK